MGYESIASILVKTRRTWNSSKKRFVRYQLFVILEFDIVVSTRTRVIIFAFPSIHPGEKKNCGFIQL